MHKQQSIVNLFCDFYCKCLKMENVHIIQQPFGFHTQSISKSCYDLKIASVLASAFASVSVQLLFQKRIISCVAILPQKDVNFWFLYAQAIVNLQSCCDFYCNCVSFCFCLFSVFKNGDCLHHPIAFWFLYTEHFQILLRFKKL